MCFHVDTNDSVCQLHCVCITVFVLGQLKLITCFT
jgi:hypothetical protein